MVNSVQSNESQGRPPVLIEFQRLLAQGFSKKELRQLCFLLNVDYDDVEGKGKTGKSRELALLMWRSGRLQELLDAAAEERPELPWPEMGTGDQAPAAGWTGQPRQLPPRTARFTGRQAELASLLDELAAGRVTTLSGPGGIGKSALAAEAVWRLEESGQLLARFPDGVLFHTFYNQPAAGVALEHFCRSYGVDPRPTPREAARMILAGKRALLILDGAEDADDLPAVLDARGGCGVLLTTRLAAQAPDDWTPLKALPGDKALELLRKWAGDLATDEEAARAICALLGRLPLAIRLAGRFMARQGEEAAAYLAWLQATPLVALDMGQRREDSVPHLMERSLAQVDQPAREALAVAGQLAFAPFDLDILAAGMGLDETALRPAVAQLLEYALLVRVDGRYQCHHALVHTYARLRVEPPRGARQRLVDLYGQSLDEAKAAGAAGFAAIAGQRPHMLALLERLVKGESWELCLTLANPLRDYLDLQGLSSELLAVCRSALKAAAGQSDRHRESAWLNSLGAVYASLGRVAEAIEAYERALAIGQELEDRHAVGAVLNNLGEAYRRLGQVEEAIDYYQQALAVGRELNDRPFQSSMLGNLGLSYASMGRADKAVEFLHQALAISLESGDRRGEASDRGNLGLAYLGLGQVEVGISYLEQALAIQREIGDRRGEARQLGNLGSAYHDLGQIDKAIDYCEQALAIGREVNDLYVQGNNLANLGADYADLGQVDTAIDYHQQALAISRQTGDRLLEGNSLGNLGLAYAASGEAETAVDYYEQALAIQRAIGDIRGQANQLGNLALTYRDMGQVEEAIDFHRQALAIGKDLGDYHILGRNLGNLGLAYHALGQIEKAIGYHEQTLAIARALADREMEANNLGNLALAYHGLGQIDRARELMGQAVAIFEEIQSPNVSIAQVMLEEMEGGSE